MTRRTRLPRAAAATLATLYLLATAPGSPAHAADPTDSVQVVLPVVDGGVTVVVAPGMPGAAPPPPGEVAPAPAAPILPAPDTPVPAGTPGGAPEQPGLAPLPPTAPPALLGTGPAEPVAPPPHAETPAPVAPPEAVPGPGAQTPGTLSPTAAPAPTAERPAPSSSTSGGGGPTRPATAGAPFRFGVFGHSTERAARFSQKMGRPLDVLGVFPVRGSWESIMDTWWLERAPEGFDGVLDVGVPLWQEDGDLATAAAGGYDQQWETLGRTIHERYPGSSVRIGWEFNLGGWKHHATDENVDQWKQAFRHASVALKRGGPSLLVSWNPNKGRGDSLPDASKAWPGDDVVDLVALDAYDWWPAYNESTWPEHRDGDQGWAYWVQFARTHRKQFAVPEWGVAPGNDHGGGDNPYFIGVVMNFLRQEHAKDSIVHSVVYFDETESYIANSIADDQVPLAGKALAEQLAAMGRAAPAAPSDRAPAAPGTPAAKRTPTAETGRPATPTTPAAPGSPGDDRATSPTPEAGASLPAPPQDGSSGSGDGSAWSSADGHGPVPQ